TWLAAYPEIPEWQERIRRRFFGGGAVTNAIWREWVRLEGELWEQKPALAAPVGSTALDLPLLRARRCLGPLYALGGIVNLVHDEIDVLIPKGAWPDLAGEFRTIAETMAGIDPRFPMQIEVAVGPDWGSTTKRFVVGGQTS